MQFSPLDYQELLCLLQDVKHMNTDHLKEGKLQTAHKMERERA